MQKKKMKTFYKAFTKNYSITETPILLAQLTHFFQCYIFSYFTELFCD
jgi:hypothetical protein